MKLYREALGYNEKFLAFHHRCGMKTTSYILLKPCEKNTLHMRLLQYSYYTRRFMFDLETLYIFIRRKPTIYLYVTKRTSCVKCVCKTPKKKKSFFIQSCARISFQQRIEKTFHGCENSIREAVFIMYIYYSRLLPIIRLLAMPQRGTSAADQNKKDERAI